ncbi:hypothetical protein PGIGA_G00129880 [Pangasianodon gigas]|uniref:Uncharacterized protein n=1 Tax=Pangasianodon gigas TaxID=30993 RepID=A0ACC5XIW8_PANGG|nr:hypothetical protein [Pangasianodon gigas]
MAHFGFENDVQSLLKLDMPITNAPMARWQRKASTSTSANTSTLSPSKSANRSVSMSKTPSKTPGKNGKNQSTPSKAGGDRFIPVRNAKQMDVASFLISKENEPVEEAAASSTNNLKVLYSQVPTPMSLKKSRYISSVPERILDAPELKNDFYLNLMDWGRLNILAVALSEYVYLWDAALGQIVLLKKMEEENGYISSVSWSKDGNFLAIGTSDCKVELWDVQCQKRLRSMDGHRARVSCLNWNDHVLSSGSRSGLIHQHDVRVADHHLFTLRGHTQEVCGLTWSPDGRYLASGGNDNLVNIWPSAQGGAQTAMHTFSEHQGAVKALAWCPWQSSILASGGGTSDRHIRIWNVNSGSCVTSWDTQSQVSSLVFAPNYKELVSGHGFAHDKIFIWKYPSLAKVAELEGHEGRILNMALSPDGSILASISSDETIRLWKCFEKDPTKKAKPASSSIIQQHIR